MKYARSSEDTRVRSIVSLVSSILKYHPKATAPLNAIFQSSELPRHKRGTVRPIVDLIYMTYVPEDAESHLPAWYSGDAAQLKGRSQSELRCFSHVVHTLGEVFTTSVPYLLERSCVSVV